MTIQGGSAQSVSVTTTGPLVGGAAIPVAVVSDGRPVLGGPAQPVYVVTSGIVQGGPALPVVAAAAGAPVRSGPAIPVYVVSGSFAPSALSYTSKVIATAPSSLIAYWPMAESGGSVALDASGNGRNGTYSNVTLGAAGIGDGRTSAAFGATTTSYINLSTPLTGVTWPPAAGSIAGWGKAGPGVWADNTNNYYLWNFEGAGDILSVRKTTIANTLRFGVIRNGVNISNNYATSAPAGFFHLAMTWDSSNVYCYFNGALVLTLAGSGAFHSATTRILGSNAAGAGTPWVGQLAHVALWNTPLSAGQIASLAVVP